MDLNNVPFLKETNVKMLFDTLLENNFSDLREILETKNRELLVEIIENFKIDIFLFYERLENKTPENRNITLIDLNKKFVLQMLKIGHITNHKKIMKEKEEAKELKKQDASEEEQKSPYTYQELQKKNIDEFEKNLKFKKNEFMNETNIKIPQKPTFEIGVKDEPIKNVHVLIDDFIKKRDYEIQNIYNTNNDEKKSNKEKEYHNEKRYIKINGDLPDVKDVIELNSNNKKKITWGGNEYKNGNVVSDNFNIFDKLKLMDETENININVSDVDKNAYELQNFDKKIEEINKKIDYIILFLEGNKKNPVENTFLVEKINSI